MATTNPPAARRPRPHPAQRARKVAGAVSVASMLALTGCMFATTKSTTAKSATATTTPATTVISTDDGTAVVTRSATAAAVAGTASTQSNTVTSGS